MRRAFLTLLVATIPLHWAGTARAQSIQADCVRRTIDSLHATGPWAALRPSVVAMRLAPVRAAGHWGALVDSLRAIYLMAPASIDALAEPQQDAIRAALDTLRAQLVVVEHDPSAMRRGMVSADLWKVGFDVGPRYSLFDNGPMAKVVVTADTSETTRRTVCWLGFSASDVATWARRPALNRLADALTRLDTRWDNFMSHGYSMLPHELLINGLLPRPTLEPPRTQLIVAHPSAATMIAASSWRNLKDSHREDALALEPIGFVRYASQFDSYGGASLLMTFPTTRTMGYGVMLHHSRFGHVAYVRRPRDPDGVRRDGVLMSLDAYRFIAGMADQWKQAKAAALVSCAKVESLCPQ